MSTESQDAFVPIRDENGRVTGIMDQVTAEYLASQAPAPTQQSIDSLLQRVTRVRIVPFETILQGASIQRTLLDTSDPASLASFRDCFAIVEDPVTFGHCMCPGNPHIELYAGEELVATLGYHHGFAIRWDAWKSDAVLKEPERLLDWMSARGVEGPRHEVEAARHSAEESRRLTEWWLEAMPECLRPYWEQMDQERDPELHRLLLEALQNAIPTAEEQVLTLFGWFGSGEGPWSGFPVYESVPEQLLLYYPTPFLVDVLTRLTLTERQWRGAARYFEWWELAHRKKKDLAMLSTELKQHLLQAARSTGIPSNVQRAERAFGG